MARLYPNLNEPWSDVDDEGVGFEAEEPSSTFCGREREGGALEPSFGGSPNAPAGESTDGVDLSEFEDHFLGRSRSGSHDPPVLQRLRKRWQNQRFPSSHAASNASPSIFEPVEGTRTAKSVSSVASWSWGVGEGAVRWAMVASLWKKVLLTVLLGLACSMLVSTLRAQRDTHRLGEEGSCNQISCKICRQCGVRCWAKYAMCEYIFPSIYRDAPRFMVLTHRELYQPVYIPLLCTHLSTPMFQNISWVLFRET